MESPRLRPTHRSQLLLDRFGGLDRSPKSAPGSFRAMKNLSGRRSPFVSVRPRRTETRAAGGCPVEGALALAGRSVPTAVDGAGRLWCGEHSLPGFVPANAPSVRLCFLGAWAVAFPQGRYANVTRLAAGETMREGIDYGSIAVENNASSGTAVFEPCGPDGTVWDVTVSDTAPASGYWLDTSEQFPVIKLYSQSQGLWLAVQSCVKCTLTGIARGLRAGDGVRLFCRLDHAGSAENMAAVEELWDGETVLLQAWHNANQGAGDYVVIPGCLGARVELDFAPQFQNFFTIGRELPQMDYVVACENRLWGCRAGDGVNELYGSKLGDPCNWSVFEGLATDSYRASRGADGPFTGAAVLHGQVLFFRENGLECLIPSVKGNHRVKSRSLCGIQRGSADSAVVLRDRLYYLAPDGVYCYTGTLPVRISTALGPVRYHAGVGGALGDCYYLSALGEDGAPQVLVYDTAAGVWFREDETRFLRTMTWDGKLWVVGEGKTFCIGDATDADGVDWYAETGDLPPVQGRERRVSALRLRVKLDPGAELRVLLSCDGGPWRFQTALNANERGTYAVPLTPCRCQSFRLRLEGRGGMLLEELGWTVEK